MTLNKLSLYSCLIVLCHGSILTAQTTLHPIGDNGYAAYSISDVARVDLFSLQEMSHKIVAGKSYTIPFTGELHFDRTDVMGKVTRTPVYRLLGISDQSIFFINQNNKQLIAYDRKDASLEPVKASIPPYLKRITPVDDHLLFISEGTLFSERKGECVNTHFISNNKQGEKLKCFGDGKNTMAEFDLPETFYFPAKSQAMIYYKVSGELYGYSYADGSPLPVQKIDKSILGEKMVKQRVVPVGERLHLLTIRDDTVDLYEINENKWELATSVSGSFFDVTLIKHYLVLSPLDGGPVVHKQLASNL